MPTLKTRTGAFALFIFGPSFPIRSHQGTGISAFLFLLLQGGFPACGGRGLPGMAIPPSRHQLPARPAGLCGTATERGLAAI